VERSPLWRGGWRGPIGGLAVTTSAGVRVGSGAGVLVVPSRPDEWTIRLTNRLWWISGQGSRLVRVSLDPGERATREPLAAREEAGCNHQKKRADDATHEAGRA
jgi:hypothetical protein